MGSLINKMKNNQSKDEQQVARQHVVEASSKTCRCCRFLARSSSHSADATAFDDVLDQLENSFANACCSKLGTCPTTALYGVVFPIESIAFFAKHASSTIISFVKGTPSRTNCSRRRCAA